MILHVLFDDKFGDYVYEQFSKFESVCKFVLLTYSDEKIKYVTKYHYSDVVVCNSESYQSLIKSLDKFSAVVMHGLFSPYQYDIIRKLPTSVKLAWVVWGGELFSRRDVFFNNLSPITKMLYGLHSLKTRFSHNVINGTTVVPLDILKRVDYILDSSEEVYLYAKQYIGSSKLKFLEYTYYTLNSLIGESLLNKRVHGKNVLVGNSASVEGNHVDILFRLKINNSISNRLIYAPLSYGEPWIINLVCKVGMFFWGSIFTPLCYFLPRYEYNKVICSCNVVIMNHYRPNALGNILTALWLGCCVFVSNKNPQTKFLKRIGLHIFSIEDDLNNFDFNFSLPLKTIEDNRTIIKNIYGREKNNINVKNVIKVLEDKYCLC